MVDNVQPRSLSCFRIRKRRHKTEWIYEERKPKSLSTWLGLESKANKLAPSSRRRRIHYWLSPL